jgi:hypothetical protein
MYQHGWSGQYDLWDEKWDPNDAQWLDLVIIARLVGAMESPMCSAWNIGMISSTRAEIGVCGGMIDSLGRTLSGLILFCEVATFGATTRRNRAELWSGLWTGRRPAPTSCGGGSWEPIFSALLVPVKANVPRGTFAP